MFLTLLWSDYFNMYFLFDIKIFTHFRIFRPLIFQFICMLLCKGLKAIYLNDIKYIFGWHYPKSVKNGVALTKQHKKLKWEGKPSRLVALESFTVYKIKTIKITLIESIDYTFGSV